MSLVVNDDFQRNGFNLVSCHNPLVLSASLGNSTSSASSGDVIVEITGSGDDTETYEFDMGYVDTTGSYPNYVHNFKLNITDIIREICNDPDLSDETGAAVYKVESRLATAIEIKVSDLWKVNSSVFIDNVYMHGFNQVNNPDSSCLVDFADSEGKIPIVAGAPLALSIWSPLATATTGTARITKASTSIWNGSVGACGKCLIQLCQPTLSTAIYNDWANKVQEYSLEYWSSVSVKSNEVTLVALSDVCEGSVLLAWLNKYGSYSYMAFSPQATWKSEQKHIGSYDIEIDDLADVKSRTKSRGFTDAAQVISAIAKNVPTEYFDAIEDLFYSMDVYYFTGTLPEYTFDSSEWLRVEVKGSLTDRKKHNYENVSVEITLPEKYTQQR